MHLFVHYLLPVLWVCIISFLLIKNKHLKLAGLSGKWLVAFFLGKCMAGIFYNYISFRFFPNHGDVWLYHQDGLAYYHTFLSQPSAFSHQLSQLFQVGDVDVLNSGSGFINTVFEGIKLIYFVFDLLSFGNLNTNTILFNGIASFAFLYGWAAIKRYSSNWFPGLWMCLLPSAFFYTSGIHKEGLAMIFIALILTLLLRPTKLWFLKILGLLLVFLLFFFFKFFVAITFLAAIFLWGLLEKFPTKRKIILPLVLVAGVAAFFLSSFTPINLPQYIVHRQQEFLQLEASSQIKMAPLEPNFLGFLKALPAAINRALFKPLPGEGGKIFYLAYTVEMFGLWAFVIFMAVKRKFHFRFGAVPALVWSLFIFALVNLVVIGYTIPNMGALVRYRSIFLPFIPIFFMFSLRDTTLKNTRLEKLLAG